MTNKKNGMFRRFIGAFLSIITVLSLGIIVENLAESSVNAFYNDIYTQCEVTDTQKETVKSLELSKSNEVYVGGFPFGVKLFSNGLIIIGFSDIDCEEGSASPAKDAGMEINDIIVKINDKKISDASDFIDTVENCGGNKIKIGYTRNNKEYECELTPSISETDGKYKTGMWLRDSTAGIGTVTFVYPQNGIFAGLGHGICDSETGMLIPMSKGITSGVVIEGIKKGTIGAPGELKGTFDGVKTGDLIKNTDNGVFGIFTEPEKMCKSKIKLGTKDDIHDGGAYILCTLDNNETLKFDITISEIHKDSTGNKNFIVNITDKKLIEKTGGIVQGMSGSPIVQDGKLIGAITHVLINDPTKGYGIFIENMISQINI